MSRAKHHSLTYRPALDGLRAVAVLAVLLYHVDNDWLPGGWLGVDLFFVLSGFLITSLLLAEYRRWGSISLAEFWLNRARRLLPGLIPMLLAVLGLSAVLATPGRRAAIAQDVLAALCYVANWRFMLGDEQYFGQIAMPSPVRHTWSLSIEEQYYIIFPILLIGMVRIFRSRRSLAAALLLLAVASAAWMAHLYIPGIDPSRVYYGTDTRAFELLVGAAAGALLGQHDFGRYRRLPLDRFAGAGAWAVLAGMLIAFRTVSENDGWIFRGGLALLATLAVVPIAAGAAPSSSAFQQALSWEPLRRIGLLSYSLYLWHWPVIVFLPSSRTGLPHVVNALVQILLSFLLAALSLEFIERPIRDRGFRDWLPRHLRVSAAVAWLAIPAVVAGSLWLPTVTSAGMSSAGDSGGAVDLPQPDYLPGPVTHPITLLGNSIPASLYRALPTGAFSDLDVAESVSFGCEPFPGAKLSHGKPDEPSAQCVNWQRAWPGEVSAHKSQLVLFALPQSLVSDWRVDGKDLVFDSPQWRSWLQATLDGLREDTAKAGVRTFAIMNLACHRMPEFGGEAELINDDARVRALNRVVADWAAANSVPIIDQYAALCSGGYHSEVNGTPLYADTLHFTRASGAIMWRWLAPQLQKMLQ